MELRPYGRDFWVRIDKEGELIMCAQDIQRHVSELSRQSVTILQCRKPVGLKLLTPGHLDRILKPSAIPADVSGRRGQGEQPRIYCLAPLLRFMSNKSKA
jgi:hypothetical protein